MRVAAALIGEGHLGLTGLAATCAPEPLDGQVDPDRTTADRQGSEASRDLAGHHDGMRPAIGAAEGAGILFNAETDHSFLVTGSQEVVATQAPPMIQQAGGHEFVSFLKLRNSRGDSHVHFFSTTTYASAGRTKKKMREACKARHGRAIFRSEGRRKLVGR
jgi:hypothetical protein